MEYKHEIRRETTEMHDEVLYVSRQEFDHFIGMIRDYYSNNTPGYPDCYDFNRNYLRGRGIPPSLYIEIRDTSVNMSVTMKVRIRDEPANDMVMKCQTCGETLIYSNTDTLLGWKHAVEVDHVVQPMPVIERSDSIA